MHVITKQSSVEARILRAVVALSKDVGHDVPKADWSDVKDAAAPDEEFCDDQFLDLLDAMNKSGELVWDEDLGLVHLPASEQ